MESPSAPNPADPHAARPNSAQSPNAPSPNAPFPAQVVYVQAVPPPHPLRRWFSWLGWIAFFFALSTIAGMTARYQDYFDNTGGIQEKFHSGSKQATDKIAIINVSGVIGASNQFVKKQIDRARDDEHVKAIVLRVDSPGGTITGSDYIYHHLLELKKERELPLVVSMGSIATSGGYYVAMAVGDEERSIYAEPTTTTGSIGVIIPHYDVSGLLARWDIKDDSLVSHPRKRILSMTRPVSEEDRVVLESYLQDAFNRFKDIVKAGRPALRENEGKLDELATGEIFSADKAKANGLVDELGFIEEAIERAAEMADLSPDRYRVVQYKTPLSIADVFQVSQARGHGSAAWQAMLELTTPRAYYLTTSLPALAAAE